MHRYFSLSRVSGYVLILSAALESVFAFLWPVPLENIGFADIPYFLLLAIHLLAGIIFLFPQHRIARRKLNFILWLPELLFVASLLFFLFSYVFALAANMDYVQRFIESGGQLRLSIDTRTERAISLLRFLPMLLADFGIYAAFRLRRRRLLAHIFGHPRFLSHWSLLWIALSVFLSVAAHPSFLVLNGIPILAWISMVPLFMVLRASRYWRAVFYGVVYGVFTTMLHNYWLGTFSLISLQVTVLFFIVFYIIFMPILMLIYRHVRYWRFLVFPLAWVFFDFARSSGFLGYPWGMIGMSQYTVLPIIQMAAVTGVWGVSFAVLLFNSGAAHSIFNWVTSKTGIRNRRASFPLAFSGYLVIALLAAGALHLFIDRLSPKEKPESVARIALIQQNSDPRKHSYQQTYSSLVRLTDKVAQEDTDLIVWSETAFVPNIRRWSQEDPERYSYARLVLEFLEYQKSLDTWLLTGNDDYELFHGEDGKEERLDYNAAILFSDEGKRIKTYRKIRLVPFTEYFPFRRQFPWFYNLLLEFDVNLWEPGDKRVVFEHPKFSFCTPICFEDVFPNEVRQFILGGAELIINLSNDYWSLTEVEARQHFSGSLFRAVENRRPLLRATASGYTAQVDVNGRILKDLPYYTEASMTVDVPIRKRRQTFYTKVGDWLPWASLALLLFILSLSIGRRVRESRKEKALQSNEG